MAEPSPFMERDDSISSQNPHNVEAKKPKNRRPANTAFRQQRLKAWQPILTPKTVLPIFLTIGVIFAPIGGLLLWASSQVNEIIIDYSTCGRDAPTGSQEAMPPNLITWHFQSKHDNLVAEWNRTDNASYTYPNGVSINTTTCSIFFDVPEDMKPPVLFYYRLTNFYQNHRRYVKSFQADQLKGNAVDNNTISNSECDPLRLDPSGKAYYPCGIVANSLFNDTYSSPVLQNVRNDDSFSEVYTMVNTGISWQSDKSLYGPTKYTIGATREESAVEVPPNWQLRYPKGYTTDTPPPNLVDDEPFQVWMRSAGLPTFSKLAQRNDTQVLGTGTYRVDIQYNFPVLEYGGTKSIVLTTRTIMGGKNPFLGIAYVIVGGICVLLGVVFTVTHLVRPRKLGDHTYLSWNNESPAAPSTAVASGRDLHGGA